MLVKRRAVVRCVPRARDYHGVICTCRAGERTRLGVAGTVAIANIIQCLREAVFPDGALVGLVEPCVAAGRRQSHEELFIEEGDGSEGGGGRS